MPKTTKKVKKNIKLDRSFKYTLKDRHNKQKLGTVEALDKKSARLRIMRENTAGSKIIKLVEDKGKGSNKIKRADLVPFFDSLSFLLSAGVPMHEGIEITRHNTSHRGLRKALKEVSELIASGRTLSESISMVEEMPKGTYIYQLKSGEKSGDAEKTLAKLSEQLTRSGDFTKSIKGALTYPIMLIVALFAAAGFMTIVLIPTLTVTFVEMGAVLPGPTLALMAFSEWLKKYALIILPSIASSIIIPIYLYKKTKFRKNMDAFFLKVPLTRFFIVETTSINFASNMSMLLNTGMQTAEAVEITLSTITNTILKEKIVELNNMIVTSGVTLGRGMAEVGFFPDTLVRLTEVGAKSAKVPEILEKTSFQMEKEFRLKLNGMIKMIEPMIIVLITVVLGFLMMAMYLPMFSLLDQL